MSRIVKRAVAALFLVGTLTLWGFSAQAKENTIESGVYIGDINLSGMTESEATAEINSFVSTLQNANITLQSAEGSAVSVKAADLGIGWSDSGVLKEAASLGKRGNIVQRYKALCDLKTTNKVYPLEVSFDDEKVRALLGELSSKYDQPAVNAALKRENGSFTVVEGQTGYVLDVEASKTKLEDFLKHSWNYEDATIELVAEVDEPEGNAETLAKVKDVLGTYTTEYKSSGSARCTNIQTGCGHITGTTLYPGEQLSVLAAITPFSVENGYELAGSYLNGTVVESLGGGICQVSTTLYNAVLLAELQVDERSNHSMIISYVEPSADAAIAESSGKDFKFTNNTEYPIYIEGITPGDRTITFTIYGVETRAAGHKVSYESEILEKTVPDTEAIVQDASLPIGNVSVQSVHIGYKARLWKIVTEDGVEVSREQVNKSTYKAVPRTATVGTATTNPEAQNQLQAAIATGSIDQVKAVATAWAAELAAQAAGTSDAVITDAPADGATDG